MPESISLASGSGSHGIKRATAGPCRQGPLVERLTVPSESQTPTESSCSVSCIRAQPTSRRERPADLLALYVRGSGEIAR